jgi:hypothetical protein
MRNLLRSLPLVEMTTKEIGYRKKLNALVAAPASRLFHNTVNAILRSRSGEESLFYFKAFIFV